MTYQDFDGNPTTLDALCRKEPAWAANRLRVAEKEHELACAVADAWANSKRSHGFVGSDQLQATLDALESAIRESPLRKVHP